MSVYANIELMIKEIFEALSNNETFLRLVSNDGQNGLNIPSTKTFNELINDRLWLTPKKLNPAQDQGTYVMVYFDVANRAGANNTFENDLTFTIDFLSHEDTWMMNDWKIRPYQLIDVVKNVLENHETNYADRGRLDVGEPRRKMDYFYLGYTIPFTITGATDLLCKIE
jgi:hypothetical protein